MGLLLNVDYSDPLARARAWKILRSVDSDVVGEEEAIDAYIYTLPCAYIRGEGLQPCLEEICTALH